jgi:RNA ligase (TIGR02306 family)
MLGIQKWEAPIPTQLQGMMKGNFPSFIPKTDQERVQNLGKHFPEYQTLQYELTEKLEGSSCTMYLRDGEFNVCSRNVNLKKDEGNTFWQVARMIDMERLLRENNLEDLAFQGELVGPKVQGNIYKLEKPAFYVFDIYNAKEGRYLNCVERQELCTKLGINHVPTLGVINIEVHTVDSLVALADGFSELNPQTLREGLVFKSLCGTRSFKAISNKYLLKQKD